MFWEISNLKSVAYFKVFNSRPFQCRLQSQ